jgi:cyclophilin family peptidyl-prolyl cis-trans isomerase
MTMTASRLSRGPLRSLAAGALLGVSLQTALPASDGMPAGPSPRLATPAGPCLRLETPAGALVLALSRAAAPQAVAALEKLARGPILNLDALPRPEAAHASGYFDGLAFDYARPNLEIRLPSRVPAAAFRVEAELDAAALGLDRELVADRGKAMDLMQMELLPALKHPSSERRPTPALEAWAARFEIDHDPSFLVGRSRRELLEAVGYRFRTGLASLPATRGAVALVPASPTEAQLTLAVLLADHPLRTGRWVVVGRVASGLDVADSIAERPLAVPALKDYRPLTPVAIQRAELLSTCDASGKGEQP